MCLRLTFPRLPNCLPGPSTDFRRCFTRLGRQAGPAAAAVLAAMLLASGPGALAAAPAARPAASAASAASKPAAPVPAAAKPAVAKASAPVAPAQEACDYLVPRLPHLSLALCRQAGLEHSGAVSVKGVPLYRTDVRTDGARLRVLVVGGIHGDELSSVSVAFHWLRWARESPVAMPHPVHWRFIPALNPDGLLMRPPQRMNARGVDLNRNFPTPNWERDAPVYWEKRTGRDKRRWPGPQPLSEPETRYLYEEIQRFDPQLIVSIHAPYGVLDFDGPVVPPDKLGRLYLDQLGIFPGSLGNYGGVQQRVPVVTVELPNAIRVPLEAEMRQMWLDLLRWAGERIVPSGTASLPGAMLQPRASAPSRPASAPRAAAASAKPASAAE